MLIIGYDYISYNGSIKCDISLPDEDESTKNKKIFDFVIFLELIIVQKYVYIHIH